ncbi:tRNA (adenine37-N(6))-methyltransferase TrmN6 [Sphingobacterium sp. JB170]|nr:tRNA (adenine37-N(6))-methyltransferase TrmN6 [Sphingobacterium sp. JB170]
MNSIFRFKRFQVDQSNCAMKINTDGVLLAGIVQPFNAQRILDIGTGTGVIAMMLAQKFPSASVHGVEIDEAACKQASLNFGASDFNERLEVIASSFQQMKPAMPYDLIVSNPPFYTRSLHSPDPRRRIAKHADEVFFEDLMSFVERNLSASGKFYCILPTLMAEKITNELLPVLGLYYHGATHIYSFRSESPIRTVIEIGKQDSKFSCRELVIYASKGVYSAEYQELLQPYFLNF